MRSFAAFALVATLSLPFAGSLPAQTDNQDARKVAAAQARIDHKADKEAAKLNTGDAKKAYEAQAKADKHTAKALSTRQAKKAAKDQDKADRLAMGAADPK